MDTTKDSRMSTFREDYPGYQGHIPYKYSIIGRTIGSTNDAIRGLLTTEPPKTTLLKPAKNDNFSHYNRDYFNDIFERDFPLEEEKIFSNKSKDAETWISGDKYKIYPQHIPLVQVHVPGIYSSNIYGMGYSKSTARAIKGDYNKAQDCTNEERYKSTNQTVYTKPKVRSKEEEMHMAKTAAAFFNPHNTMNDKDKFKKELYNIYHSKIAQVPTVGYAGTQSIFQKQISYLNYDKILENEKVVLEGKKYDSLEGLPPKFRDAVKVVEPDEDVPYVVGYKGFRVGVKARNWHGENFHDLSLKARNEAKMCVVKTE